MATKLDGRPAAPNTVARKRAVFYGALRYAVELRLLDVNPIDHVQWTAPRSDDEVDRQVVVNPKQAKALRTRSRRWLRGWSRSTPACTTRRCGRPRHFTSRPMSASAYHLRHAAVSLWLNAGVPATQVAEWADSVHVLLKVYAKCIDGQDEAARRCIETALGLEPEE